MSLGWRNPALDLVSENGQDALRRRNQTAPMSKPTFYLVFFTVMNTVTTLAHLRGLAVRIVPPFVACPSRSY